MSLLFIGEFLSDVFFGIIMLLDTFIYTLVNSSYKIFMAIAGARLLSSDVYFEISNNIYIIVGVVMLFVLSYAILKAIVSPDEFSKGEYGAGMIKRVLIAVIGLAITPVLFNLLYQAQGLFLEQDVLGKIFFRIDEDSEDVSVSGAVNASDNSDVQIKSIGGAVAATSIWQAFFHPAEGANAADIKADASDYYAQAAGTAALCGLGIAIGAIGVIAGVFTFGVGSVLAAGATVAICAGSIQESIENGNDVASQFENGEISLEEAYGVVAGGGDFDIFLVFKDNYLEDGTIDYMWGVSTIAGAFALYAFASFSIDMGIRAAKLAYYQIIAPVPLIMQVLPKFKDTFGKYIKNVISTFVEVFIRISVVYIVVFVICHLQDLFSSTASLWGNTSLAGWEKLLALALLIIGLILFAKSAPDIICQSLNIEKGNMNLGIGKKLRDAAETSKAYAVGGVAGAGATSAVRNFRKEWEKGHRGKAFLSAAAGLGSGAARAAFNQFGPGPNRKEAKDWNSMKNVASKAAMQVTDKKERADKSLDDYLAAKEEYDKLSLDFEAAKAANDHAKMDELRKKMQEAHSKMYRATILGQQVDNAIKAVDAWSVGTIDLSREQADLKFAGALKKLRDEARDIAYDKDDTYRSKMLKKQLADLQAREISEYADGWDEQSYNDEVRRRRDAAVNAELAKDSRVSTAQHQYDVAQGNVTAAQAKLNDAQIRNDTAAINAAQTELSNAKLELDRRATDLTTARAAATATLGADQIRTIGDQVVQEVAAIAKKDATTLERERMELQREIKITRDLMEAAADEWVSTNMADPNGPIARLYQEFLSSNSEYISANIDHDVHKGVTVADLLAGLTEDGGKTYTKNASKMRSFELTGSDDGSKTVYVYDQSTGKYKIERYEAGQSTPISQGDISIDDLFSSLTEKLKKAGRGAEFKAKTTSTETSGKAKKITEQLPMDPGYMEKVRRKRESEQGKK